MTELVKVTLSKDWNKHSSGSNIQVDTGRATWLQQNGYLEEKVETKVKKSGRVSKPKTD